MFLVKDDNFLRDEQKLFINNIFLSSNFSYYLNHNSVPGDNNKYLSHTMIKRPEDKKHGDPFLNSEYADQVIDIFKTFLIKNKIDCQEILRCAVNLTFKTMNNSCPIHNDHDYEHKQLLIYLNDCVDKTAKTVLLDDKGKKILHKITPKQYTGVCFNSCPHYMIYPKKDIRVVLVYTFR